MSKHIVTADDIRTLAASGESELMVREHTLLTDAALDAARMHGVRLVEGGATSLRPPEDDVVHALPEKGGLPAPALSGLVRGAAEPARSSPPPAGASDARIEGLPDYGGLQTKLLIGGEWLDAEGGQTVPTVDPATNRTIVEVAAAQPADVDRAVRAARDAFPAWRDLAPEKRSRILLRVAELIEAEHERLARIESHDVGKPIREAALVDLPACWDPFRFYQGLVRVIDGRVLAMPRTIARLRPQGADGRRRDDHPLELPAAHRLPQGSGGAGGRQHRGAQGARAGAADLSRAGPDLPGGGHAARASSTWCPAWARWPAPRWPSTPASTRSPSPDRPSPAAR